MAIEGTSPLVGVVIGHAASPAEAAAIADRYRKCPYCTSFTSSAQTGIGIFTIPPNRRWWLEDISKRPKETMGFDGAETVFTDVIEASSPWTLGDVKPNLHPAPCGLDCRKCKAYGKNCQGCPSTLEYLGS